MNAQPPDALERIRYPIGRFERVAEITVSVRTAWIEQIRALPGNLRDAVNGLNDAQLNQCYREGGWTVRQVVHHVADEHLNAFAYCKMALTEVEPVVKTYDEPAWAKTPDASLAPIEWSLSVLEGLHARWTMLFTTLTPADLTRGYAHKRRTLSMDDAIELYAWHGRHHTAHITELRIREKW